jgi:hypothetical protein
MKTCSKCKVEKSFDDFHFRKDQNNYRADCKECHRKKDREYNIKIGKNSFKKLKFKKLLDNGLKKCPKCNTIKNFDCFGIQNDKSGGRTSHCKDCIKKSRLNNFYKRSITQKIYYENKIKEKLKTDYVYKFKHNVRGLITGSFKRGKNKYKKNSKTEIILGCTIDEFRIYIQNKFTEGMTLDNHGQWHLDHIIPISIAETEEDVIKLCHYTNFQPLWAADNIRKSNKIITDVV